MKANNTILMFIVIFAILFVTAASAFIIIISKVEDNNVRIALSSLVAGTASYMLLDRAIEDYKMAKKKAE